MLNLAIYSSVMEDGGSLIDRGSLLSIYTASNIVAEEDIAGNNDQSRSTNSIEVQVNTQPLAGAARLLQYVFDTSRYVHSHNDGLVVEQVGVVFSNNTTNQKINRG